MVIYVAHSAKNHPYNAYVINDDVTAQLRTIRP